MTAPTIPARVAEPRWEPIVAILVVLGLVLALPGRYQLAPPWFPVVIASIIIGAMLAVTFLPASIFWHRVERLVVLAFFVLALCMNSLTIGRLAADMITHQHDYSGITLLESAAVIWTVNVLLFALLYWQVDRAGPEARAAGDEGTADFDFAELREAERAHAWRPHFIDYLFIAFATSTSFTPPDYAKPGTRRAKGVVMVQASISLVTLFLIASRAIATLS